MKKIVPFTKDLMFKTKIGEITSIALDNTLKLDLQNVSGEFVISGTYKILESSQIEEEFKYNIPVDITIDSKYETSSCSISIDDFSYEIINEEKLKVNISVMLDDLDIKEDKIEKIEVVLPDEDKDKDNNDRIDKEFELLDSTMEEELENLVLESKQLETKSQMTYQENKVNFQDKLLENMTSEKEYSIYRVYTLKEDDTLDLIYEKFNTSKEILADYNDLDNLVVGSKIIIPSEEE